jgi:triosephosphate isomerase
MKNLVVGNWKLYVNSLADGRKLLKDIDRKFPRGVKAAVAVCPQVALAAALKSAYGGKRIAFGIQDVSFDAEGAHTGSVSPLAVSSTGIQYAIVGHVERRALGDSDEIVSKKAAAALSAKLHPIICVGEPVRDAEGAHFAVLAKNVSASLARIDHSEASRVTIAYDPLWAIGQKEAPSSRIVSEAIIFVRKTLAELWGREAALKTRIIYGGSVTPESAAEFKKGSAAQGLLVGRASVDADSFTKIIKAFS